MATPPRWDYQIEKTFVCTSTSQARSLSSCTASTQGYGARNPRKWRGSVPSAATDGSECSESKTLWEHTDEMKRLQGVRDIHGVLQCFSNIKRDGFVPDTYCYNIIINMFGKLEKVEEAERWFEEMESCGIDADASTFAVLMDAYGIAKNLQNAEWCLEEMGRRNLTPSISHFNILISAYARQGLGGKAEAVFQKLPSQDLRPDVHTFGAMIDMYAQLGKPAEAEEKLMQKLREMGCELDKTSCCMMMNAHANAAKGANDGIDHVHEAVGWQRKIRDTFGNSSIQVYDYTVLFKACARATPRRLELACALFREQVDAGIQPDLFNIRTLCSVGHGREMDTINTLIEELEIDVQQLETEFQDIGDEHNFDQSNLNRKLWKLKK